MDGILTGAYSCCNSFIAKKVGSALSLADMYLPPLSGNNGYIHVFNPGYCDLLNAPEKEKGPGRAGGARRCASGIHTEPAQPSRPPSQDRRWCAAAGWSCIDALRTFNSRDIAGRAKITYMKWARGSAGPGDEGRQSGWLPLYIVTAGPRVPVYHTSAVRRFGGRRSVDRGQGTP